MKLLPVFSDASSAGWSFSHGVVWNILTMINWIVFGVCAHIHSVNSLDVDSCELELLSV